MIKEYLNLDLLLKVLLQKYEGIQSKLHHCDDLGDKEQELMQHIKTILEARRKELQELEPIIAYYENT